MNKYRIKLDVEVEVEAFNPEDASEYIHDIFNIDDEIKKVNIVKITTKQSLTSPLFPVYTVHSAAVLCVMVHSSVGRAPNC